MTSNFKLTIVIASLVFFGGIGISQTSFFQDKIESWAIEQVEKTFGSQPLSQENAQLVHSIAHEMGIDSSSIHMRKFHCQGLHAFGYFNACATFHTFLGIPIYKKPFLFISQGFFEDLSPEEQHFLIGHELIHIRDEHLRWSPLLLIIMSLLIIGIFIFYLRNPIISFISHYYNGYYTNYIGYATIYLLIVLFNQITNISHLAYARHIEKIADIESITLLNSHEGGLGFLDKIVTMYKSPLENPYYGLLENHPSNKERIEYITAHQTTIKKTNGVS